MRRFAPLALLSLLALANVAEAQRDALSEAERAYQEVDFERTLRLAEAALEAGGHDVDESARIYQLIGIAAAALGDEDRSRDAYTHMLALRPDTEIDLSLAPRLRSPFLEARGFWAAQPAGLGARVSLLSRRGELRLTLSDPIRMAASVVMVSRVAGAEPQQVQREAASELRFALPGFEGGQVEYYARVLDGYGNAVVEIGSEDEPHVVGQPRAPGPARTSDLDTVVVVALVVAAVLVVGAGLAVGGYYLFGRGDQQFRAIATFE